MIYAIREEKWKNWTSKKFISDNSNMFSCCRNAQVTFVEKIPIKINSLHIWYPEITLTVPLNSLNIWYPEITLTVPLNSLHIWYPEITLTVPLNFQVPMVVGSHCKSKFLGNWCYYRKQARTKKTHKKITRSSNHFVDPFFKRAFLSLEIF